MLTAPDAGGPTVRVAAAQTPDFREDIDAALNWAQAVGAQADDQGVSLLCFPEAFLQGYLLEETSARAHALDLGSALGAVLLRLRKIGAMVVMGLIEVENGRLFNTAVVVEHGELVGRYRKAHLLRGEQIFEPGEDSQTFDVDGLRFAIIICNDANFPETTRGAADLGAALIVCPANNMLPRKVAELWRDKHNTVRAARCRETGLWLMTADVTGERDGAVSWGPTNILDPTGQVRAQAPLEQPGLMVFDLPHGAPVMTGG